MRGTRVLIEAMSDAEAFLAAGSDGPVTWYSTSPMVVEALAAGGKTVYWADRLLPPDWPSKLGHACLNTVNRLEPDVNRVAGAMDWPHLAPVVLRQLFQLLTTLAFKRAVVEEMAKQEGPVAVVGETKLSPVTQAGFDVGVFDTVFASVAKNAAVSVHLRPPMNVANLFKDIDRPVISDRILSWADVSADQLLYRLERYLFSRLGIKVNRRGSTRVIVLRSNEITREMLPGLLLRGATVMSAPKLPEIAPGLPAPKLPDAERLTEILAGELDKCGVSVDASVPAEIAAERLSEFSRYWQSALTATQPIVSELIGDGRPTVLVSNTISGLAAHALTAQLRRGGVPCIVAQHGVSASLTRYHKAVRNYLEPASCDAFLVCAEKATKFFQAPNAPQTLASVVTIGMARKTRKIPLARIQRLVSRRRIGASKDQRVVIYLARSIQNNLRKLPFFPEDHEVHSFQRAMADRVMPFVRGIPVIKLYSTRRYRDPDPMAGAFAAPAPVKTLKAGDFRYLRAGADVIILESPLSTLGWVMGTGKPVFYLAHPSLPLLPDAEAAMKEALFFFDISQPDWPERLVASLNRPDKEILAGWQAKAEARSLFLREYVFGPEHAGRNGAVAVIDAARIGGAIGQADAHKLAAE